MDESSAIEATVKVGQGATWLNHVRENRIEYLMVLVLFHLAGGIQWSADKLNGACGL